MKLRERNVRSGSAEEAVVGRAGRVVEEVLIGKEIAPRDAGNSNAVRRTEVEVEDVWTSSRTTEGQSVQDAREKTQMIADPEVQAALEYKGYQALIDRAVDVFGDDLIASRWLSMPSADLNGDVPLHVAQKLRYEPASVQRVFEPIFVRIEHGIYF